MDGFGVLVVSNLKHYGPDMVIALDPLSDDDLGFRKAAEALIIKKIIPRGTVKAFT